MEGIAALIAFMLMLLLNATDRKRKIPKHWHKKPLTAEQQEALKQRVFNYLKM